MWETKMAINEVKEIRAKTTVFLASGPSEKLITLPRN